MTVSEVVAEAVVMSVGIDDARLYLSWPSWKWALSLASGVGSDDAAAVAGGSVLVRDTPRAGLALVGEPLRTSATAWKSIAVDGAYGTVELCACSIPCAATEYVKWGHTYKHRLPEAEEG